MKKFANKSFFTTILMKFLLYNYTVKYTMKKNILLLIIVSLFLTGCFQKDVSQEDSKMIDIGMSEENEITSS
jgi:hypothetical protein